LPALAPSRIEAPLVAELRSTLEGLESSVPTRFDTGGQFRMTAPSPVGVRYTAQRTPFRFESRAGALHAETTLSLGAEACVGATLGIALPLIGAPCQPVGSCGVDEAPRQVVISTDTTVGIDPSWRLVSQTRPGAVEMRQRCLLSAFHFDVSDYVARFASEEVARATAQMDRRLAEHGDLRPRAEAFWTALQEPIALGEGFWLVLQPEAVHAGAFTLDPATVRTTVGVPALQEGTSQGEGFRMTFDAQVSFADATALVAQAFRGRTLTLEGHQVLVRDIRVEGSGSALLFAIQLRFQSGVLADEEGTVYLAGLPDYDTTRGALVVRNVDYTMETRSVLMRLGEWLLRGSLREAVARQAVFPMAERLERLRRSAEAALSRTLAPGTQLHGRLSAVRPQGAWVVPGGVVLRVVADGSAEITQDLSSLGLTGH
jgi:hypothetical protein